MTIKNFSDSVWSRLPSQPQNRPQGLETSKHPRFQRREVDPHYMIQHKTNIPRESQSSPTEDNRIIQKGMQKILFERSAPNKRNTHVRNVLE